MRHRTLKLPMLALVAVFAAGCSGSVLHRSTLTLESLDALPAPDEVRRAAVLPIQHGEGMCNVVAVGPHRFLTARHCLGDAEAAFAVVPGTTRLLPMFVTARGRGTADWIVLDLADELPLPPVPLAIWTPAIGDIVYVVGNNVERDEDGNPVSLERLVAPAVINRKLPWEGRYLLEGPAVRRGHSGSLVMAYDRDQERWVGVGLVVEEARPGHGIIMPMTEDVIAAVTAQPFVGAP